MVKLGLLLTTVCLALQLCAQTPRYIENYSKALDDVEAQRWSRAVEYFIDCIQDSENKLAEDTDAFMYPNSSYANPFNPRLGAGYSYLKLYERYKSDRYLNSALEWLTQAVKGKGGNRASYYFLIQAHYAKTVNASDVNKAGAVIKLIRAMEERESRKEITDRSFDRYVVSYSDRQIRDTMRYRNMLDDQETIIAKLPPAIEIKSKQPIKATINNDQSSTTAEIEGVVAVTVKPDKTTGIIRFTPTTGEPSELTLNPSKNRIREFKLKATLPIDPFLTAGVKNPIKGEIIYTADGSKSASLQLTFTLDSKSKPNPLNNLPSKLLIKDDGSPLSFDISSPVPGFLVAWKSPDSNGETIIEEKTKRTMKVSVPASAVKSGKLTVRYRDYWNSEYSRNFDIVSISKVSISFNHPVNIIRQKPGKYADISPAWGKEWNDVLQGLDNWRLEHKNGKSVKVPLDKKGIPVYLVKDMEAGEWRWSVETPYGRISSAGFQILGDESFNEKYALCIGVSGYSSPFQPLYNSDKDAEDMSRALSRMGYKPIAGSPIILNSNVKAGRAPERDIRTRIINAIKSVNGAEKMVLYISGYTLSSSGQDVLLLPNAKSHADTNNMIPINQMMGWINDFLPMDNRSSNFQVIVMLDLYKAQDNAPNLIRLRGMTRTPTAVLQSPMNLKSDQKTSFTQALLRFVSSGASADDVLRKALSALGAPSTSLTILGNSSASSFKF